MCGWLCFWVFIGCALYGWRRLYRFHQSKNLHQVRQELLAELEALPKESWIAQERGRYLENRLRAIDLSIQRGRRS